MPFSRLLQSITNIPSSPAFFTFEHAFHQEGREAKKEKIDGIDDHALHGGDFFDPVVINEESYHHIERLTDLAPLHNGAALSMMQVCIKALPRAKSFAYFDTSFLRSIPLHIASYAIKPEVARKRGLKKYRFHGLSYAYILEPVSHYLQKPASSLNLMIMHLGSGASACAIENGRSLDTAMGLTPLIGLPGATRSGAVDPSLVLHYTNRAGRITDDPSAAVDVRVTEAESILNTESGWHALTGTADFDEVVQRMKEARAQGDGHVLDDWEGDAKWKLAFDLFTDRITVSVGAYFVRRGGGGDALVFSRGIREKSAELREEIVRNAVCLGFKLDRDANDQVRDKNAVAVEVRRKKDTKKVLLCETDEQLEMGKECDLENAFWQ